MSNRLPSRARRRTTHRLGDRRLFTLTSALIAGVAVSGVALSAPLMASAAATSPQPLMSNHYDVIAYSGRLLALNRDARQLEVVDPTLAILTALPLPDAPRRIMVSEAFPFDGNGNGTIEPGEFVDAAFIGGDASIVMVDMTSLQAPRVIGMITMPTWINDLDVDRSSRRLAAVDIRSSLYLVDLTRIQAGSFVDANGDGVDDRVAWTRRLTDPLSAVRIDKERHHLYVGTNRGVEVYALGAPNLTGTATFTNFPMIVAGLDYANPQVRPIRGAIVELRTSAGALLQATNTDATGYYSFDAPQGTRVQVFVRAELGRPDHVHADVINNIAAEPTGVHANGLNVMAPNRAWAKASAVFTVNG